MLAFGAGGLRFNSRVDRIGHSVVNDWLQATLFCQRKDTEIAHYIYYTPMPSLRGARGPYRPISIYSEYVLETLRNDKTTDSNGKRNNNIQT